ncbi:MAG: heme biosynthesis HemY N-terminal domain-containing protein [Pseudomonadota bacterium]
MKLFLLALLVVVVLGGVLGTLLVQDPGYILVSYGEYALETSLWVGLFLLAATYLALRGLGVLLRSLLNTQSGFIRWRSSRALRQGRAQTVRGTLMLTEGRWVEAERQLIQAAEKLETPLVNYLGAAKAAEARDDREQADHYLRLAQETTPGSKFAVMLTQAQMNLDAGQYEQCLATAVTLQKRAPKHPAVLTLLARCYAGMADGDALLKILPALEKVDAVTATQFQGLLIAAWRLVLPSRKDVRKTWKELPDLVKMDDELLGSWVDGLVASDASEAAESVVRQVAQYRWSPPLIGRYGTILTDEPQRQLIVAQNWLKDRVEDPVLFLTLGRLCLRNDQFEQARDYFESSLRLQPTPEVYGELGRLLIAMGDEGRGTAYLLSAIKTLPELPMPENQSISKVGVS